MDHADKLTQRALRFGRIFDTAASAMTPHTIPRMYDSFYNDKLAQRASRFQGAVGDATTNAPDWRYLAEVEDYPPTLREKHYGVPNATSEWIVEVEYADDWTSGQKIAYINSEVMKFAKVVWVRRELAGSHLVSAEPKPDHPGTFRLKVKGAYLPEHIPYLSIDRASCDLAMVTAEFLDNEIERYQMKEPARLDADLEEYMSHRTTYPSYRPTITITKEYAALTAPPLTNHQPALSSEQSDNRRVSYNVWKSSTQPLSSVQRRGPSEPHPSLESIVERDNPADHQARREMLAKKCAALSMRFAPQADLTGLAPASSLSRLYNLLFFLASDNDFHYFHQLSLSGLEVLIGQQRSLIKSDESPQSFRLLGITILKRGDRTDSPFKSDMYIRISRTELFLGVSRGGKHIPVSESDLVTSLQETGKKKFT